MVIVTIRQSGMFLMNLSHKLRCARLELMWLKNILKVMTRSLRVSSQMLKANAELKSFFEPPEVSTFKKRKSESDNAGRSSSGPNSPEQIYSSSFQSATRESKQTGVIKSTCFA